MGLSGMKGEKGDSGRAGKPVLLFQFLGREHVKYFCYLYRGRKESQEWLESLANQDRLDFPENPYAVKDRTHKNSHVSQ